MSVARRTADSTTIRDLLSPTIQPRARPTVMSGGENEIARTIIAMLLRSRFRKGSLAAMDADCFVARHVDRVAARVARNAPIQLTLVGFPFKVPNPLKVGPRTLPDLAEVAALRTLERLHRDVRDVYAPGIEVVILHDGTHIAEAFGVPLREAREYSDYFLWLLEATGTDAFIRCEDLARLLPTPTSSRQIAPANATHDDAAFRKTLGMLDVRWIRTENRAAVYRQVQENVPSSLMGEAASLYRQVRRSMERYAECDEVLHHFDPRPSLFPDAIHATTKTRPGRLALWLVRRGRSILPWHGVGVLSERGRIDVMYAAEIEARGNHRPVFLNGENTPFLYERS